MIDCLMRIKSIISCPSERTCTGSKLTFFFFSPALKESSESVARGRMTPERKYDDPRKNGHRVLSETLDLLLGRAETKPMFSL